MGALLEKKLAQPPMTMERSGLKTEVLTKRVERLSVREKKADGADIPVVCAMPYK
jgi:hypothetical protein